MTNRIQTGSDTPVKSQTAQSGSTENYKFKLSLSAQRVLLGIVDATEKAKQTGGPLVMVDDIPDEDGDALAELLKYRLVHLKVGPEGGTLDVTDTGFNAVGLMGSINA